MGFIFRSAFWLVLASILVPAEARLGHDGQAADGAPKVALGDQIHDAAYAAWAFLGQVAQTCETNPDVCKAGQNLAETVADTGSALVIDIHDRLTAVAQDHMSAMPESVQQTAQATVQRHAKFQARVE